MMRKRSAVLTIMLLFCFSLCGCIGQPSSGEDPSKGANVETSPTGFGGAEALRAGAGFRYAIYKFRGELCR